MKKKKWLQGFHALAEWEKQKFDKLVAEKGLTEKDIKFLLDVCYAIPPYDGACRECNKLNKGIEIMESLSWTGSNNALLRFDCIKKEILVSEEMLMHFIQLANPQQPVRKIKLFSMEEEIKHQIKDLKNS